MIYGQWPPVTPCISYNSEMYLNDDELYRNVLENIIFGTTTFEILTVIRHGCRHMLKFSINVLCDGSAIVISIQIVIFYLFNEVIK